MNKIHLLHEAEKLYSVENLTPEMIAEKLNISRRTVFNWKKEYNWDEKRFEVEHTKYRFSEELLDFARKMMQKISTDIDKN